MNKELVVRSTAEVLPPTEQGIELVGTYVAIGGDSHETSKATAYLRRYYGWNESVSEELVAHASFIERAHGNTYGNFILDPTQKEIIFAPGLAGKLHDFAEAHNYQQGTSLLSGRRPKNINTAKDARSEQGIAGVVHFSIGVAATTCAVIGAEFSKLPPIIVGESSVLEVLGIGLSVSAVEGLVRYIRGPSIARRHNNAELSNTLAFLRSLNPDYSENPDDVMRLKFDSKNTFQQGLREKVSDLIKTHTIDDSVEQSRICELLQYLAVANEEHASLYTANKNSLISPQIRDRLGEIEGRMDKSVIETERALTNVREEKKRARKHEANTAQDMQLRGNVDEKLLSFAVIAEGPVAPEIRGIYRTVYGIADILQNNLPPQFAASLLNIVEDIASKATEALTVPIVGVEIDERRILEEAFTRLWSIRGNIKDKATKQNAFPKITFEEFLRCYIYNDRDEATPEIAGYIQPPFAENAVASDMPIQALILPEGTLR